MSEALYRTTQMITPSDLPRMVLDQRGLPSALRGFLLAREELLARLTAELSPERISILSRGELAKVVDAAVQAHFVRKGVEPDPIVRRDLITALIKGLLEPKNTQAGADDGSSRRSNRSAVESAKAQIQPAIEPGPGWRSRIFARKIPAPNSSSAAGNCIRRMKNR